MLSDFEEVDHITYCSAIPISSGFSQFCLKIPYPNQPVNQEKSWFWYLFWYFSSDDFRQKLSSQNTRMGFQSINISKFYWWAFPPDLPGGPYLRRLHDSFVGDQKLSRFHILTWLDCLITGTLLLFSFFKYLNSKCLFFKWWIDGFFSL